LQAAYRCPCSRFAVQPHGIIAISRAGQTVDVSLRHGFPKGRTRRSGRPTAALIALSLIVAFILAGIGTRWALISYRESMMLTGLTGNPEPVRLAVAGERLAIPANMIRYAKTRTGGPVERVELVLHWPTLSGYSDEHGADFADGFPKAPIILGAVAAPDSLLDSTGRLDEVYARFFTGNALPGPAGLVGRKLAADSGYSGEVIYFAANTPRPFVARCLLKETDEIPSTCLREFRFGRGLSMLYRFRRSLLADWKEMDTGLRALADGFLVR
jgi:hypothetical protein